jgi:hypothetical protein
VQSRLKFSDIFGELTKLFLAASQRAAAERMGSAEICMVNKNYKKINQKSSLFSKP